MRMLNVLNEGYVRLVDKMGSDLTPVNAARVSYDKSTQEMRPKDCRLLSFLAREGHTSPFRHAVVQFEVYAPLMVARQWWKYVVGSSHQDNMVAWNESSRRYITEEPRFYIPDADEWREALGKQGSGESLDYATGIMLSAELIDHIDRSLELYEAALEAGVCAEQARLFLPAYGMYVRWYWTASLLGVAHFLNQRMAQDAQKEIREYAEAVLSLVRTEFPLAIQELVKGGTANAEESMEKIAK